MKFRIPFGEVLVLLMILNSCNTTVTDYSREFQLQLDLSKFSPYRDEGIEFYYSAWADASGVPYTSLQSYSQSIRQENLIRAQNCGTEDFVTERIYLWGDWTGLSTVEIKSHRSLNKHQAEDEPFWVAEQYNNQTIRFIEEDLHPCESDYAASSRVYLWNLPYDLNSCGDLKRFFPYVVSRVNRALETTETAYTITAFRNGTFLDTRIELDITLYYDSLHDALNNNNCLNGEFSFTIYEGHASADEIIFGYHIYQQLLDTLGSLPNEYPC